MLMIHTSVNQKNMKLKVKNPDHQYWSIRWLLNGPLDGIDILKLHECFGNTSRMDLNQEKLYEILKHRKIECSLEDGELYVFIDDKEVAFEILKSKQS